MCKTYGMRQEEPIALQETGLEGFELRRRAARGMVARDMVYRAWWDEWTAPTFESFTRLGRSGTRDETSLRQNLSTRQHANVCFEYTINQILLMITMYGLK